MKNRLLKYFQIVDYIFYILNEGNEWLVSFMSACVFTTFFIGFVVGIFAPFKEYLDGSNFVEFIYFQVIPISAILSAIISWQVSIKRKQFIADNSKYKSVALTKIYRLFSAVIIMVSLLLNIHIGIKHGVVVVLFVMVQLLIYPYLFYLVSKFIQKYDLYDKKTE